MEDKRSHEEVMRKLENTEMGRRRLTIETDATKDKSVKVRPHEGKKMDV